jgi:hypothetical protein
VPLESKAQGRFLNWKFGHDWVRQHGFGGKQTGLPQYVHAAKGNPNVGLHIFRQKLALLRKR